MPGSRPIAYARDAAKVAIRYVQIRISEICSIRHIGEASFHLHGKTSGPFLSACRRSPDAKRNFTMTKQERQVKDDRPGIVVSAGGRCRRSVPTVATDQTRLSRPLDRRRHCTPNPRHADLRAARLQTVCNYGKPGTGGCIPARRGRRPDLNGDVPIDQGR